MYLANNRDIREMIEESVPGKQVTTTYMITLPVPEVYECLDIDTLGAISILTLSPFKTVIIAAGIAAKASNVQIGLPDRLTGSVVVTEDVESVDTVLRAVDSTSSGLLGFNVAEITRTRGISGS